MTSPTRDDPASWLEALWSLLHDARERVIPEGIEENDAQWDEICTVMAWIAEDLGVETPEND